MGTDFHTVWRNADGSLDPAGFAETPENGTYAKLGYHMSDGSSQPVVTTVSTQPVQTTTATTTTGGQVTPIEGDQVHNFTLNGVSSSFYTISGSLSTSKGTVNYNGITLTQCLKLETATTVGFTAPSAGKLTLVFAESDATIKVDGTKYTSSGDGIITVDVSAGAHTVSKADAANLFYMVYAPETSQTTASATTTTTTTSTESNYLAGDANVDGKVDISDAVMILQVIANSDKCGVNGSSDTHITEQGVLNGDVYKKGSGLTTQDALSIQKYVAQLITALPES